MLFLKKLIKNSVLNIKRTFKLLSVRIDRESVATAYLKGNGIEIGALHNPLKVSSAAHVKYVDRMSCDDLRSQYPELKKEKLVPVDIVDDGERLDKIADESQDFVIANHFLEHSQNPLLTFSNIYRVLRSGGVLYLALPDKRYSFDAERPVTTLEHLQRDLQEGPAWSRRGHFEEWARHVNRLTDPADLERQVENLMALDYSIHFHAWDQREMIELLLCLQDSFPFELEMLLKHVEEQIFILRKQEQVG